MRPGSKKAASAIILAAGRGSRMGDATDIKPKCMTLLMGRPLLSWQTASLRAAGMKNITVVGGYRAELLRLPGHDLVVNENWETTNMVASLRVAGPLLEKVPRIVSYGDIVYRPAHVAALARAEADIAITFDRHWKALWSLRFDDPLSDAETFRQEGGRLIEIGGKPKEFSQVMGQYMGLLKISPEGWRQIIAHLDSLEDAVRRKLDMTSLLRGLLAKGAAIGCVPVDGGWCEVDHVKDARQYEEAIQRAEIVGSAWSHDWRLPGWESRLRGFYRARLKKYGPIRDAVGAAQKGRQKIKTVTRRIRYGLSAKPLALLPARDAGGAMETWVEPSTLETPAPAVYPGRDSDVLQAPHASYRFPGVRYQIYQDAVVRGLTNLVQTGQTVYSHDLYDFTHDATSEEFHDRLVIDVRRRRMHWLENGAPRRKLKAAAGFTDACANNYAHWLTEVLPRVALYWEKTAGAGGPLLIDQGLHRNIRESLGLLTDHKASLLELGPGEAVEVGALGMVSPTGYIPWGRRRGPLSGHSQGIFCPVSLGKVREKVFSVLSVAPAPKEKLWVRRRQGGMRSLLNAEEIERWLLGQGFRAVEPEFLTFAEQVRLFAGAERVVGATGAAMANLIFCPPGAKITVLQAKYTHANYWYWQNMALAVGLRTSYALGRPQGLGRQHLHSDFTVNLDAVREAVSAP